MKLLFFMVNFTFKKKLGLEGLSQIVQGHSYNVEISP